MVNISIKSLRITLLLAVLATSGCSGGGSTTSSTAATPATTTSPAPATWFVAEGSSLTAAQVTSLFDTDQLYFNVRSTNSTAGEIRGGISPSSVRHQTDAGDPSAPNPANIPVTFSALLGGDQVRPRNVITTATAYGSVTLDPSTRQLTGFIVSSGISGTTAHIQDALPGSSGAIVLSLEGGPVVWTVPSNTILSYAQIARLTSGAFYFSVRSNAFPDGEIRGQLNQQVRCAALKGSNEVPPVTTGASAVGFLALTQSTSQFSGFVKVAGLSSAIRSVGLHIGAAGTNGIGIIFLENRGGGFWVVPVNTVLSSAQVADFNNDELYFNIHTNNNTGGELRGQLLKATVLVGTATLDGNREVPPVSTSATGAGYLAWNSVTEQVSGSVVTDKINGVSAAIQSGSAAATGQDLLTLRSNSPVTVTPTPGISYALDIQPIFTARCTGSCHSLGGLAPMSLESGVSYAVVRLLLVPGNSASSYLYQRLTINSASFPQMPLNRAPLNSSDRDLIKTWIDRGALNN